MPQTIFLAGATGVIGRTLIPLLRQAGHAVTGTSRTADGAARLRAMGIDAAIVDVFDADALTQAVAAARPSVILHQLTDLSAGLDPAVRAEVTARNARLRRDGTANLVRAAQQSGAGRIVAQSIAWAYAPQPAPHRETDPLDLAATGLRGVTVGEGVAPLEAAVLGTPGLDGIVLRNGELYGPGTWSATPTGAAPVHVDAAAYAVLLAVDRGAPGAYNIAEPGGSVIVEKAMTLLGWRPDFRVA